MNTSASSIPLKATLVGFDNAIAAVKAYAAAVDTETKAITTLVTGLQQQGQFVGEASNGFLDLYESYRPEFTTKLCDQTQPESLTAGLVSQLENIREAILAMVDPQLAQANRSGMPNVG